MLSVVIKFGSHTDLDSALVLPLPSWLTLADGPPFWACFLFCKIRRILPTPGDFSKALYHLDFGRKSSCLASVSPSVKWGENKTYFIKLMQMEKLTHGAV